MADKLIAKYSGPLHGVVLYKRDRNDRPDDYYTRCFDTRADLGYVSGEFQGHYDLDLKEGLIDFMKRVRSNQACMWGDLRERWDKDLDNGDDIDADGIGFWFDPGHAELFGVTFPAEDVA